MRKFFLATTFFMSALFLSSCVDPGVAWSVGSANKKLEASGSPYRFRVYRISGGTAVQKYRAIPPMARPVPSNLQATTADSELKTDILKQITLLQQDWGNTNPPVLLGVKSEGFSQNSFKESWFILQDNGAIHYKVTMTPSPQGGTDFQLEGPLD